MNTRHPFPIRAESADRAIDDSLFRFHLAPNQSDVFLLHCAIFELCDEILQCHAVFSDDHDAGSVFIQAVNDSGSALAADSIQLRTMMQKRVDQCASDLTSSRVNDDSGGFVNDNAIRIFPKNLERQFLGSEP